MENLLFLMIVFIGATIGIAFVAVWMLLHPRLTFALYLLLIPFHTLILQILKVHLNLSATSSIILSLWKEGVLLILFGWVLIRTLQTRNLSIVHPWIFMLIGFYIFTGVVALRTAPNLTLGAYAFRGTFEPLAILFLTLSLPIDQNWLKKLTPKMLTVGGMVAGFAIFQSLVLGFEFLKKFYSSDGSLAPSFFFMGGSIQRAMGTFSSPNQLSLYLSFIIILSTNLLLRKLHSQKYLTALLILSSTALLLTVSRSGWLASVAGISFSLLLWRRKSKILLGFALLSIFLLPVFFYFGFYQHIENTLLGREVSANYHLNILVDNIQTLLKNPMGFGLGRVGARVLRFEDLAEGFARIKTESYFLQIGLEVGIIGLLLFLLIIVIISWIIFSNIYQLSDKWSRAWAISSLSCLIAAMIHAVLIPDLQDLVVASYLWFFAGIGLRLPAMLRGQHA